jgi:hypothetical protein
MGGAAGLAAVAGASLGVGGSADPASASPTNPSITDWINIVSDVTPAAKADAVTLPDAAMTVGSRTLTSASASFTSGDVGKSIGVAGAGASGANLTTTISGFTNSTTITLTASAGTTVSGATAVYGTDNSTSVQNAIAALPSTGGVVYFPAGNFVVGTGGAIVASAVAPIYFRGAGRQATQLDFVGTGDCLRMYNSYLPGGGPTSIEVWGGGIEDMTVDGTCAGNSSTGVHIGDMKRPHVDVNIQNFAGSGSIGLHCDNTIWWTENGSFDAELINCTSGVVFDVSNSSFGSGHTSSSEFDNNRFHFGLDLTALQNGVVLQNGAYIYHADMFIHGGIRSSGTQPSGTWAALVITGAVPANHPGAGNNSFLEKSRLSIMLESGGNNTYYPQTINQGTTGNRINECNGIMSFRLGPWTASNIIPSQVANQFTYFGIVDGDNNLNPGSNNGLATISPLIYGQGNLSASGVFDAQQGDFFAVTLSQNVTLAPNTSGSQTGDWGGPQRKTFIITQAASGGPYTVSWPSNSHPTTSSPTVVWLSGVTPVMPTAAKALMVVELTTIDGETWYGSQPGAAVSGQYLCPPTFYAPSTVASLAVNSSSYTAVSSANINTGSFTAPPSGSVVVTASFAAQQSAAGNVLGFTLVAHGTSTTACNAIQVDAQAATSQAVYTMEFIVTSLTPGASYNFDLAAGSPSGTITVHAYGNSTGTATSSRGAPATMTVQAV